MWFDAAWNFFLLIKIGKKQIIINVNLILVSSAFDYLWKKLLTVKNIVDKFKSGNFKLVMIIL